MAIPLCHNKPDMDGDDDETIVGTGNVEIKIK